MREAWLAAGQVRRQLSIFATGPALATEDGASGNRSGEQLLVAECQPPTRLTNHGPKQGPRGSFFLFLLLALGFWPPC